jgi:hypothetical protein
VGVFFPLWNISPSNYPLILVFLFIHLRIANSATPFF